MAACCPGKSRRFGRSEKRLSLQRGDGGGDGGGGPVFQQESWLIAAPPSPPFLFIRGEGATLIRDGAPPTRTYPIDPFRHGGALMEVPGVQTPPPLRRGRQAALGSSSGTAGREALPASPWDGLFGNIGGRRVQMSAL